MNSLTKTASAIRFSLVSAITLGTAFTGINMAQAAEEGAAPERIQVTGSRIQRSDMETASPVTVLDADAIKASGATSLDEILQGISAANGAMTNPGVNNGSGGNASINLRGLGSQRTLVLINGRRAVPSGTGATSTVDLNAVPVSMIQRIEVLKDGASAVYGSDAIAGVVNIILRKDFEGAEINLIGGISDEGDAEETGFDITLGSTFDKGNIVFGLQYLNRGDASQADRGFSECPIFEGADGFFCGGSSYAPGGTIWTEDGKYKGDADNSWREFNDGDFYNYSEASFLRTPMQKVNFALNANYEVADEVNLFVETTYAKRWSEQQMAPQPIWSNFVYADWMDTGADHPFVVGDEISYGRRMTDIGPREFSQNVDTFQAVIGLQGYVLDDWQWEVAYNFGRNDAVSRLANLLNMGEVNKLILEGPDENGDIPFNPLLQEDWSYENLKDKIYTEQDTSGTQLEILSANIGGEFLELPAGYLGMAAGIEHRKEKAWNTPDSLTAQGYANDPKVEPTAGEFDVTEAYVEFAVPLLADLPGVEQLDLSAAVRYFDYNTFGDDYTWKLGLTWQVFDDLMIRGVRSTAFRAPTIGELYAGDSPNFSFITHPVAQDQGIVTIGGNEMLTPEEADIITAGFVYEPSWFDGFSMTLDYYNIDITNAIAAVDDQYIVDLCLDDAGNKINTANPVCASSGIYMDSSNRIQFDNGLQNIGAEKTSGYDLNMAYAVEAAGFDWRFGLDTTYLEKYDVTVLGNTIEYAGIITGNVGSFAKWKSNFTATMDAGDFKVSYAARWIDGMDNYNCIGSTTCLGATVPSVVYHDLSGSYFLTDTITLRAGVDNIFDKEPPYYTGNNDSNTDPYTYDTLGRYFYVGSTIRF